MGKRVGVAVALVAAIVIVAWLIYRSAFVDESAEDTAVPDAGAAKTAVVAPPPDAAGPRDLKVGVTGLQGVAERKAPGGEWVAVEQGDELSADDSIRTSKEGRATLDIGGVAVTVDNDSVISIPALRKSFQVQLGQGRLSARVPDTVSRRFGVAVEGGDAVAETGQGEFAVLTTGKGDMAVATTKGKVAVSAKGKKVEVKAGQQTTVRPGTAPSAPIAIPAALLLKVQRPRGVQRAKRITVRGRTTPGSIISINGVPVKVGEDGEFTSVVALNEGKNAVTVETRDVTGRRRETGVPVTVDTRGPDVGGDVTWGKKPK